MKIIICDDNRKHRDFITTAIKDTIALKDYDMEIALSVDNPISILKYIKDKEDVQSNIYFLDVDLKCDINGIKLGEEIRTYDARGFIVYVTTRAEMSYLTFKYKVEALDYIIKDDLKNVKNNIEKCLYIINERFNNDLNQRKDSLFSINVDNRLINIDYDEILFFETSTNVHRVILHSTQKRVEFYGKLKDIEEQLDDRFYRCHKAYIVNKDNIKEIDKKNRIIYMLNDEECHASVRLIKNLNK